MTEIPAWLVYFGFPIGALLVAYAFWKPSSQFHWYDPERPRAFILGMFLIAFALDAAIFGYLPVWGD